MSRQTKIVRHRWNLPEGQEPPRPGQTIRGKSRAHSWRVVEVIPIESPIHPNAWSGRLAQLGPWDPSERHDFEYSDRAERQEAMA